jgi:hypothetical protein
MAQLILQKPLHGLTFHSYPSSWGEGVARLRLLVSTGQGAMGNPYLIYVARADATAEGELATLATVYAFILQCHEKKAAGVSEGGEAADRDRTGGTVHKKLVREP